MHSTDWNRYYSSPFKTARLTRAVTQRVLIRAIRKFASKTPSVCELGGANSHFYEGIKKAVDPSEYHVIDNNAFGLELLRNRSGDDGILFLHCVDILHMPAALKVDLAFSIGLIEHFQSEETRKAIKSHLNLLKPGGIAIISFPTPTVLYRLSRKICELLGLWIFHDERPLAEEEVLVALGANDAILFNKVIWAIFLTQRILVIRHGDGVQQ